MELLRQQQQLQADKWDIVTGAAVSDTGRLRERQKQLAARTARLMTEYFSESEIRSLCMDFQIDYESIDGDNKVDKIRALVLHFYRHNTLDVFIDFLGAQRPAVDWQS